MKTKIFFTALLAFAVSACSTVSKVVYRIDVPQGNYLEADKVAQLQVGQTREQVQYLLGTPMLQDPFTANTWYYVYLQQVSYEDPVQHNLVVKFDAQGRVASFDLDKELNNTNNEVLNNAIINAPEAESSSWWQFWK